MKRGPAKRSSLFLLELIIAVLFFCLASSVCIQLFVQAHLVSQKTRNLNVSVNQVSSMAELMKNDPNFLDRVAKEYPLAIIEDETATIFYNRDFEPCKEADAVFRMNIIISESSELDLGVVRMVDIEKQDILYEIPLKKHQNYRPHVEGSGEWKKEVILQPPLALPSYL